LRLREVVIVESVRTPIGSFGGSLRDVPVVQLGSKVIGEVLRRKGLRPVPPKDNVDFKPSLLDTGLTELEKKYYAWDESSKEIAVDEVIMGNVLPAGQGQKTAKMSGLFVAVKEGHPAYHRWQ